MGSDHRCGGQNPRQLQPHWRSLPLHPLHQTVLVLAPGSLLLGHQGRESGDDELEQDMDDTCRRLLSFLPQLVDTALAHVASGQCHALHLHDDGWLHLPLDGRTVDEPSPEAQPHGGCLQQREREFHAGDPADGERVFRQPAHSVLLQEEMAEGLGQRCQPLPCHHRVGHARQRQVLCRGQQLHQATDRKGLLDVYLRLQVPRPLHDCLQPHDEPSGRLYGKTAVLRHQLRRPSQESPLQSHPPGLHERHLGCLRECLHHHAQPQQDVGAEAGRLLRGESYHTLCRHHLVLAHLQGREVLHLPPCHRTAQPPLRGCVPDFDELSRTGELPLAVHGRMAGRSDGAVGGTDCQCQDSVVTNDFTAALLGDVGK